MEQDEQRTARFGARVPVNVYETIKRAAEIEGRSLTDYVMGIAYEHALDRIERAEVVTHARESSERLADMLIDPPPLAPAMRRAIARHGDTFEST